MKWILLYARLLFRYARYYLAAKTRYGTHSPFVFALIEEVLEDKRNYYAFTDIEGLRRELLRDKSRIALRDLGAGSLVSSQAQRRISSLARYSAISPASGRLLFRLLQFAKPKSMLELGTSLGLSGAYQAASAPTARFITIEGCPETAKRAKRHFERLGLGQVDVRTGSFEDKLPRALEALGQLDYLYLDGDHRKGASLKYIEACLPYAHKDSLFVIADIHWSNEMEAAWAELRQRPEVRLSIDLFHFGLLFFREEFKEKQHFALIEARRKPWRLGFFSI